MEKTYDESVQNLHGFTQCPALTNTLTYCVLFAQNSTNSFADFRMSLSVKKMRKTEKDVENVAIVTANF